MSSCSRLIIIWTFIIMHAYDAVGRVIKILIAVFELDIDRLADGSAGSER